MKRLKIIAGNCILENLDTSIKTSDFLVKMSKKFDFDLTYKSSFKKDNRSSVKFYSGPTEQESIKIFKELKKSYDFDILTDFHNLYELESEIIEFIDVLQIPAYLCMQTELVLAMSKKNKKINVKKGQFLSPEDIGKVVFKIEATGNKNITITERGTSFGYRDLIVDPRAFLILREFGYPVFMDLGHSVRKYGVPSSNIKEGGQKRYVKTLARAAVANHLEGLFVEVHPDPNNAKCDAATQLSFEEFENLLNDIKPLWNFINS
jgi:2-dehydro-3-deoxyphosphooctonate aldolase (KDO 8-P synthase)